MRRWRGLLLTFICVEAIHGCGQDSAESLRWIPEEPQKRLLSDSLYRHEDVIRWHLGREDDGARWVSTDPSRMSVEDAAAVTVRSDGSGPHLVLSSEVDADDVDALDVVTAGRQAGHMTVRWAGPEQPFDIERRLVVEGSESRADGGQRWRFDLRSHPGWRGRVTQLQLRPSTAAETVHLRQIALTRRTLEPSAVTAAAAVAWRADLGQELRSARIALPELAWTPRGRGNALQFAYGIQPGVPTPVQFEVLIADADGARSLWQSVLDPDRGDGNRWHEARVALPEQRRRARILFRTIGGDADPTRGLALWGDARLVDTAERDDRRNLLLICLDTLRADALSSYGNPRPTSPRIDRWASDHATLFERVIAAAPWTLPAHATMFTGLDAVTHGSNHFAPMPYHLETLAERLRAAGWRTGAVTGGGYLRPGFALDQGFDTFAYWQHLETDGELLHGLDRSFDWLAQHADEPFFLFFHTYEVHYPHRRRQPWFDQLASERVAALGNAKIRLQARGWEGLRYEGDRLEVRRAGSSDWSANLTEAELELVRTQYESAVAMADDAVGQLIDHLSAIGVAERTVVVVTSDHGEALGEGGRAGHTFLEDENSLVPLIIALPDGVGAGHRVRHQVRQADLMPSLLDALGLDPPTDVDGRSLLADMRGGTPQEIAPAWTYAASANRGLAQRSGGHSFHGSVLAPWRELHSDSVSNNTAAVATSPILPPRALRRSTREYVDAHHGGLRLELRNASQGRLVGVLSGGWADHARIKTLDPECDCLSWNDESGPAFDLASGQQAVFLFEMLPPGSVGIRWRVGGDPALPTDWNELSLEPGSLAEPVTRVAAFDGWDASSDRWRADATGLKLWWPKPDVRPEPAAPEVDAGTRAQLRALGYLE
jgi:arylsulfatase A-like enzyme